MKKNKYCHIGNKKRLKVSASLNTLLLNLFYLQQLSTTAEFPGSKHTDLPTLLASNISTQYPSLLGPPLGQLASGGGVTFACKYIAVPKTKIEITKIIFFISKVLD